MYNILCIIYHVYILKSRLQLFFNFGSRWALSQLKCMLGHFWPFSGEFLENSKKKAPKYRFDLKLFLALVFARIIFDGSKCFFADFSGMVWEYIVAPCSFPPHGYNNTRPPSCNGVTSKPQRVKGVPSVHC